MTTHERSYNYVLDIQVGNNVNVMIFSIYINNIEKKHTHKGVNSYINQRRDNTKYSPTS